MSPKKRLLSIREACHYLGVVRSTLLGMEEHGLITPLRTAGGHRRYSIEQLEELLETMQRNYQQKQVLSVPGVGTGLSRFARSLSLKPASVEQVAAEALHHLLDLFQVEVGAVMLADEAGEALRLLACMGLPKTEEARALFLNLGGGPSGEAFRSRQPVAYDQAGCELPVPFRAVQGVCVPLTYGNVALGVVHIVSAHRRQFFPSEIDVLSTIALYLAGLIVNTELLVHYDRRLAELSLLNRISTAMQGKIELADGLNTFLDETIEVMQADAGLVLLLDPQSGGLRVEARLGFPEDLWQSPLGPGEGIPGWVVKYGRAYVSPGPDKGPAPPESPNPPDREIASRVCVPLMTERQTIGALYIATRSPRAFDDDDVRFLSIVASQAAVIIRRALLYVQVG